MGKTKSPKQQIAVAKPKKINRLKKWWIALNINPPTNRLQKLNIYAIVGLSLASLMIGIATISNQTEVKTMGNVVKELSTIISAGKPSVRISSVTTKTSEDTILYIVEIKNYGGRYATKVYPFFYILDTSTNKVQTPLLPNLDPIELAAGQATHISLVFPNKPENQFYGKFVVGRIIYTDSLVSVTDTSFDFWRNGRDIDGHFSIRYLLPQEREGVELRLQNDGIYIRKKPD